MKFACGIVACIAVGASAFAPNKASARSSTLASTTEDAVYTFTKSEEIFAEAQEVCRKKNLLVVSSVFFLL